MKLNGARLAVIGIGSVFALTGCADVVDKAEDVAMKSALNIYDCADLASEAVDSSSDGKDDQSELLKVRNPRVVKDNRKTWMAPTGDGEALILSCKGTGVWSDIDPSPVLLKLTVDSDGDQWIQWEGL